MEEKKYYYNASDPDLPAAREAQEKRMREGKELTHKAYYWGFILFGVLPSFCMFAFHDAVFDNEWNPLEFIVAVIPLIFAFPLLLFGREMKAKEKEFKEREEKK